MKVAIIDYGLGNIKSIFNACKFFSKDIIISNNYEVIKNSTHLIFPGVGSFDHGINLLKKSKLHELVAEHFINDKPLLGICLGLQIFFNKSEEGIEKGLGLIDGTVLKIKKKNVFSREKVPIISWREVVIKGRKKSTFYFDHSYMVSPKNKDLITGYYIFEDQKIPSIIKYKNFIGCQFHPEKSGKNGLGIIEDFFKKKF